MKSNLQKIDHIVVLMLENRSFDNLLGFLGALDPGGQKVNGVAGKDLSNPIPEYAPHPEGCKKVPVGVETKMTNPNPDPGEEYAHVNTQLFGRVIPEQNRYPPFDAEPYNLPKRKSYTDAPMNGFVTDYINHFNAVRARMPDYEEYKIIMNCHTEEAVPVLSTLAKEYAVFDAWFASVPSQTICNRSFMHTSTSQGYVLNAPYYHWLWNETPTIFDRIQERGHPEITWKIYFDELDVVSFTGLQYRSLWQYRRTNFFHIEDFESDAANGNLPSYSFIEPRFFIDHNDQHPPIGDRLFETSSVLAGELLIERVYNAVRNGEDWSSTLLIITFDEHGGCYDHVSPPTAAPPDPNKPVGEQGFQFDRLGVRVPTVMVSPYIKRGTVISEAHDHTSILKLVCDRWNLQPLTKRDKHARRIDKVLNLEAPRADTVLLKAREYKVPRSTLDEPVNDLQKTVLFIMAGFEDALKFGNDKNIFKKAEDLFQLVMDEERIARIKTVGQAVHFAAAFDRRVTKHLSFFAWLRLKIRLLFQLRR
jgi:phospholipase C